MSGSEDRFEALKPKINKIMSTSSTAGAPVGVFQRGKVVFWGNYGFRDHGLIKGPDRDALYNIGSLTKSMVAAAAGILVSIGKLHWGTLVSEIVPEFKTFDRNVFDSSGYGPSQ
jgi:CubicO group peptidase (beta-lactamase class C family)